MLLEKNINIKENAKAVGIIIKKVDRITLSIPFPSFLAFISEIIFDTAIGIPEDTAIKVRYNGYDIW